MNRTPIEWTDFTANPVKYRDQAGRVVWACEKVSHGCLHCYAESLAHRYRRGGPFSFRQRATLETYIDEVELRRMLTYKPAAGKRCFVGDMTDLFGEWVTDQMLDHLFAVFALRSDVTWQVLTKRAGRLHDYLTHPEREARWMNATAEAIEQFGLEEGALPILTRIAPWLPLPNVWLGVSAEHQKAADQRIPLLTQTPAAVRFVSAEPLLGPIDVFADTLTREIGCCGESYCDACAGTGTARGLDLHWVIVGGESGPQARPCALEWVRDIVETCLGARLQVFVKQLGSQQPGLSHGKGGDPSEWPEDLRVRQFPAQEGA